MFRKIFEFIVENDEWGERRSWAVVAATCAEATCYHDMVAAPIVVCQIGAIRCYRVYE